MGKTLQYELWQECNNHCKYCTLGNNALKTSDFMKLDAIKTAITELKALVKGEVDTLGFIGGEMFQGQLHNEDVKAAFFELITLSNELLNEGIINNLWLNATLTIGEQEDLYSTLKLIDQTDKVWILTSYDTIGRFHNMNMLSNWHFHMDKLWKLYPEIKRNTTMIITGDFIKKYVNDEIDLQSFEQMLHTSIFLKTPVKPDDKCNISKADINKMFKYDFFPTKLEFVKFLVKYKAKEGEEAYANLFSNDLKAEEVHKNFNDEQLRNVTFHRSSDFKEDLDCDESLKHIETMSCGHSIIYQCYVDCDGCAICDKKTIGTL